MIQNVVDFIQSRLPAIVNFGGELSGFSKYSPHTSKFVPAPTLYDETVLTIYGSGSSVVYKPINKYTQSRFNNDVQKVTIELSYHEEEKEEGSRAIMLSLKFSCDIEDTELSITLQDEDAKEKTRNVEEALLRVLEPNKNRNSFFYPNDFVPTLVFVIGFVIGLFGLMVENAFLKSGCTVIFGAAIYFVAHRFIKGYCSFDTPYQKGMDIFFLWLTRAVIAFIVIVLLRFTWKAIAGS